MSANVQELRQHLREKFPEAHRGAVLQPPEEPRFGAAAFPAGTISELIPADDGGLALWVAGLLSEADGPADFPDFVLVDGGDAFDPASHSAAACSHLLWLRCSTLQEVLKAADLLVRDGNVPFILLDLVHLPKASLRGIPAAQWWRLKQLCEKGGCRLVVLAPFPLVPCASLRLALSARLTLADFDLPRREVLQRVTARTERMRHAK